MAVVSISRIQVRRGQKNTGSGLPQLASGEFGWAVDSQELYIGNGSVSEASPFVGNTKLLSEADNLFEFAKTYQYKTGTNMQTGSSASNPVLRTLQQRLDDRVSIRSFGANGDGTNQTVALQRAIDQLYLNASNKGTTQARVELILEAGEYTVTGTIHLPPYTTIRGAGADKTIINAGNHSVFETVNETSTPGVYSTDATSTTLNQARNIKLSGMTITTTRGPVLSLKSCKNSVFEDLIISGAYTFGSAVDGESDGIRLTSLSTAVSSNGNLFKNVTIKNCVTGIKSDNDIKDNTWTNCTFDTLWQGFAFGFNSVLGTSGMLTGPINNKITESKFDNIYGTALTVANGTDNISKNNKFHNIGNHSGSALNATTPVIKFVDIRNISDGDWFQRSKELGYTEEYKIGVVYHPEVKGPTITDFSTTHQITIGQSGEYIKLFRLPADVAKGYEIDYVYKSSHIAASRTGTMVIVVDPTNDTVNFSDDYNYTGSNTYAENLKFKAQTYDEDGDLTVDTLAIMMLNLTSSDNATLYYKVKTKS